MFFQRLLCIYKCITCLLIQACAALCCRGGFHPAANPNYRWVHHERGWSRSLMTTLYHNADAGPQSHRALFKWPFPSFNLWPPPLYQAGVSFSILSSQSFLWRQPREEKKYNSTSPALNDFIYVYSLWLLGRCCFSHSFDADYAVECVLLLIFHVYFFIHLVRAESFYVQRLSWM